MLSIFYKPILHKNENRILVQFEANAAWNKRMQKVPGVKWSKTYKGWTIPDTPVNRKKCGLEQTGMMAVKAFVPAPEQKVATKAQASKTALIFINDNNKAELNKFLQQLVLRAYSPSTIRTYRLEFAQLLKLLREKPVQQLTPVHLQRYLLYCIKNGLSENGLHSRLNALKFYFEQVLGRDKFFFEIPRPKKPVILPKVFNEDELGRMFTAIENLKHKAIVFTAYSAGLRVSEVVNIKLCDIDSKRMQIFIERAKGKKDRYVKLSVLLLDILRQYLNSAG